MEQREPKVAEVYIKQQSMSAVAIVKIGDQTYDLSRTSPSSQHTATFRAAITALAGLPDDSEVIVHSDLEYLVNTMNDFVHKWIRNGWRKGNGESPANLDEVRALVYHSQRLRVTWLFDRLSSNSDLWAAKIKATTQQAAYSYSHPISLPDKPLGQWSELDWKNYYKSLQDYFDQIEAADTTLRDAKPPKPRGRRTRKTS